MVSLRFSALVSIICAAVLVNVSSAQTFDKAAACTSCFKSVPAGCEAKINNVVANPQNTTLAVTAYKDCICTDVFVSNFDCLSCAASSPVSNNTPQIQQCQAGKYNITVKPTTNGQSGASNTSSVTSPSSSPTSDSKNPQSNSNDSSATTPGNSGASRFVPTSFLAGTLIIALKMIH